MGSRLTLDRRHSLAGRENIAWFFANRKWIRLSSLNDRSSILESAWAKRPLPAGDAGIRFLLLAPKRSYKRAHDRNKMKRWLRAAITKAEFLELEEKVVANSEQILLMMRISKPIREVTWAAVLEDVRNIKEQLKKRV